MANETILTSIINPEVLGDMIEGKTRKRNEVYPSLQD